MNLTFLLGLAVAGALFWAVAVLAFTRLSRNNPFQKAGSDTQPALRLAEKWLMESQRRVESLVAEAEQPLSAAQNELLELRLEAGRLPQGIKDLRSVRDLLEGPFHPRSDDRPLGEWLGLYLGKDEFREGPQGIHFIRTPLGEMPLLRVGRAGGPLQPSEMREALGILSRALDGTQATGGFLFLQDPDHYRECLANGEWMEGLKAHRLMAADLRGLTALLVSLRLAEDSRRVLEAFRKGIESTKAMSGQTDLMSAELSRLASDALKARTQMEGALPTPLGPEGR